MKKIAAAATCMALCACSTFDRTEMSRFEPDGMIDGVKAFRFYARADSLVYRNDSAEGEAERTRWLDRYMAENNFCTKGYQIDTREAVAIDTGMATVHDVFYRGRCKP